MSDISNVYEYNRLKNKYINLKEKINSVVNQIDDSIAKLDLCVSDLNKYYLVDGYMVDSGKTKEVIQFLSQKKSDLINVVIPRINDNILYYENLVNKIDS